MPIVSVPDHFEVPDSARNGITVQALTLIQALREIDQTVSGLSDSILDSQNELRRFVRIAVDDKLLHARDVPATKLQPTTRIRILVGLAGG